MTELDIVERLRGKVRVPVNDGAGLLDGRDFFERTFPTSKAAMEAADEIERLRHALQATQGRIINVKIDLQTRHTKAAALKTLDGIIKFIDAALAAVGQVKND